MNDLTRLTRVPPVPQLRRSTDAGETTASRKYAPGQLMLAETCDGCGRQQLLRTILFTGKEFLCPRCQHAASPPPTPA
jgi:hypothetical protein